MPSKGYEERKELVDKLKEHYSRNWLFEPMKRKHQIKFKFKENKSQLNGRIYLSEPKVQYSLYGSNFEYIFLEDSSNMPKEFLNAFWVFYPTNRGSISDFDEWIQRWLKDKRKRNKPYRQLIGEE